jgi:hypothetical protein
VSRPFELRAGEPQPYFATVADAATVASLLAVCQEPGWKASALAWVELEDCPVWRDGAPEAFLSGQRVPAALVSYAPGQWHAFVRDLRPGRKGRGIAGLYALSYGAWWQVGASFRVDRAHDGGGL